MFNSVCDYAQHISDPPQWKSVFVFSDLVWTDGYSSSLDVMIIFLALDALNELFTWHRAKTFVRNVLTTLSYCHGVCCAKETHFSRLSSFHLGRKLVSYYCQRLPSCSYSSLPIYIHLFPAHGSAIRVPMKFLSSLEDKRTRARRYNSFRPW